MASQTSTQKTAPIAINSSRMSAPQRDGGRRFEVGPPSFGANGSVARADLSCQSCQHSGAKCVASDDEEACTACVAVGSECSLTTLSPQTRKRKLESNSNANAESSFKRG